MVAVFYYYFFSGPQSVAIVDESYCLEALRAYILFLPLQGSPEVVLGQENRVPEPISDDFVVMTPMRRTRLATNLDAYSDCTFVGSIAGNVLTVSQKLLGTLQIGATIFCSAVAAGTKVTGYGAAGTYIVNISQTVVSQQMAAGQALLTQETELTIQLDVHGPNSGDNAETITTAMRDDYTSIWFDENYEGVYPLYADDAVQAPFMNDQQEIEYRWVIEAKLQYNPTTILPQQFADRLKANTVSVQATFPA